MIACRPKGILSSRAMRNVVYDLHKADALIQISGVLYENDSIRNIYYAEVLEQHGITQAQFDSSLVWYTAHPQLFDKIYPKVVAKLQAEERAYYATYIVPAEDRQQVVPTLREPLTPRQLDSLLWVYRNGYPSTWIPLVQDPEEQLLPQVSILR